MGGHELRHEVKFAAHAWALPAVRHWLRLHDAGFRESFPPRQVNNVYFDSWDYRAYAENLAGISRRSKVRYRWYGAEPGPQTGTLEVKHRRNQLGWKQRFNVDMRVWVPGWAWDDVRSSILEQTTNGAKHWLDQAPHAVFINRYRREYFVSGNGRVRATIDTEQRIFDQRMRAMPNLHVPSVSQDTLVLELKFAPEDRLTANRILADVPMRIGRHSKYMNAVRAIALV